MARSRKGRRKADDVAARSFALGCELLARHPLFAPLVAHAHISRSSADPNTWPPEAWAVAGSDGIVTAHPTRRGEPEEWLYVLGHCLLHLGFDHFQEKPHSAEWVVACDAVVADFLRTLRLGRPPAGINSQPELLATNEERLYELLCERGVPPGLRGCGVGGPQFLDFLLKPPSWRTHGIDWQACLGRGLSAAVASAVSVAAGYDAALGTPDGAMTPARRALRWIINSYPLLGAMAANFRIVDDRQLCHRLRISAAAVDAVSGEVYVNPAAGLDEQEARFVVAHELLHAGLRHDTRRQGRDPFLWNVACDYVINGWLVEMGLGELPRVGGLYDPELMGESAESLYDRIVIDLRRYRKLWTLAGPGCCDILEGEGPGWWAQGRGLALDDLYRRCLSQGLSYHQEEGRGLLPSGLVEEIRSLAQPPIAWDVELAQWFDDHFAPLGKVRSYARPSRRQSATPDIPRPRCVPAIGAEDGRTYGVVLDTSGSMDRALLGKALGAIASYSVAREVPLVRVVFCDAAAYDQGYMPPEDLAGRVRIRGRGGTILQPGIELLQRAEDFPKDGPILVITDGQCDRFRTRREHAILLPEGHSLPFVARGKVFRIR
jgi:predicted metal-dependent peptidase